MFACEGNKTKGENPRITKKDELNFPLKFSLINFQFSIIIFLTCLGHLGNILYRILITRVARYQKYHRTKKKSLKISS